MNELVTIDPKEYGLEEVRATEIAKAFQPYLQAMIALEQEFADFKNLVGEPPKETCEKAKELKLKYVKIRTGTASTHKAEKAVYLNAGRFVDAWKNRQLEISKEREDKLDDIANYYINIEKERIAKLEISRREELLKYLEPEFIPNDIGSMHNDIYVNYISGIKAQFFAKLEAEKIAEEERLAAIEAEKKEQERIRKENERLQKEAQKREVAAEKERREYAAKLKAQEAEAAAERAKAEAILKKEREERANLEAEKQSQIAAERAMNEALKRGSDKEKLKAYFDQINMLPFPTLSSIEAQAIADAYESFLQDIFDDISKL